MELIKLDWFSTLIYQSVYNTHALWLQNDKTFCMIVVFSQVVARDQQSCVFDAGGIRKETKTARWYMHVQRSK